MLSPRAASLQETLGAAMENHLRRDAASE
jgi:hypothetical protein